MRPRTDPQPQNHYEFSKLLLVSGPHVLTTYIYMRKTVFFFRIQTNLCNPALSYILLLDSLAMQDFFLFHSVQTDSGADPASYPMDTGVSPLGQSGRGVKLTTHLHLVPRSRKVELYLHSPICHHGIVFN
jgi:hypothetical protein